MIVNELEVDLFDVALPTIIVKNGIFEVNQNLKQAKSCEGAKSQILICKDNIIEKVIIIGYYNNEYYCKEFEMVEKMKLNTQSKEQLYDSRGVLPADFPRPTEEEMNEFRKYVAKFNWRVAKTFENFSPHQYILNFPCWKMKEDGKCRMFCDSCKKDRAEFEKWALFIRKYGERLRMLKTVYTVFCCDGKQYWTMGDPMNTTWVLNRALIEDPRRKPKLYWLDRV